MACVSFSTRKGRGEPIVFEHISSSFPRSSVGMPSPTLRVVRPPNIADAERPGGHSHGGPWERVTKIGEACRIF